MTPFSRFFQAAVFAALFCLGPLLRASDQIVYEGGKGPGAGKHIVFLTGDEEYRSEEGLPMLAKILAERHGFKCTVLFSINAAGVVDPDCHTNEPGLEALDSADLCVMLLRFREWPDAQMKHFVDYLHAGKPIIALRTSTHAFAYEHNKASPYAKFDWASHEWPGGFGQQVLGETWVSHHGDHGKESTRGLINKSVLNSPAGEILLGVTNLWWPSDVYTVAHRPDFTNVLVWGQVLTGMDSNDAPVTGPKNEPLTPVVWVAVNKGENGRSSPVVTTTAGASVDLQNEGLRRLLVNACYWTTGLGKDITPTLDVSYAGPYQPTFFGFGKARKGLKPQDFK